MDLPKVPTWVEWDLNLQPSACKALKLQLSHHPPTIVTIYIVTDKQATIYFCSYSFKCFMSCRMAANAADSEPRQGDCYPALPAEHGSELEITHFGAECVTKVVKDGSEWIRTNAAAAEKRSSPGEQVVKTSADVKLNKLQQLRAQYQRFHRERRGQYPLDDVQDQYEQQLQDQERNLVSERNAFLWQILNKKIYL